MVDRSPTPGGAPGAGASGRPPRIGDFFWLGTGCAICVVGGGAIGYGLDAALGTTPWITFGGLAFGVVSAVLLAVAQVRKFLP
ncbi:MAG: AtpZ/AtpI family protein [Acidimicrobiales bacterium]